MIKRLSPLLVFSIVLAACLCGCNNGHENSQSPGDVVARVNDSPITGDDIAIRLGGGHAEGMTDDMKKKVLEDLIDQELLYQNGLKLGLDKDPKYRQMVQRLERRLINSKRLEMARRVYNTRIASSVDVTDQEARAFFDKNADVVMSRIRLGVLHFADRGKAEQTLRRLKGGEAFDDIASGLFPSHGKEEKPSWDTGFITWDKVPAGLRDTVFGLKPGEISDIIDDRKTGIQIIKVIDIRKKTDLSYDKVRGSIMEALRDQKIDEEYKHYLEQLRREAKIVKLEERRNSHEER